jgi:hypothetical protein
MEKYILKNLAKRSFTELKQEDKELQDYIKMTSQCKTCGGDQWKIYGGMKCGLPGKQYWPA